MPMRYKIDVLAALKEKGFTTYKLRKEGLLGEGSIQALRKDAPISWASIACICELLNGQRGDILEVVSEAGNGGKE